MLTGSAVQQRAQALRQRIRATVERHSPQVMVKVTGGGRGMGAIAAHLRYIAKAGRLPIEDYRGVVREGKAALRAIADQWRFGGTRIPEVSERREAFNIMLSMPTSTDARVVQQAAPMSSVVGASQWSRGCSRVRREHRPQFLQASPCSPSFRMQNRSNIA